MTLKIRGPADAETDRLRRLALAQRPWRPSTVGFALAGLAMIAKPFLLPPASAIAATVVAGIGLVLLMIAAGLESKP